MGWWRGGSLGRSGRRAVAASSFFSSNGNFHVSAGNNGQTKSGDGVVVALTVVAAQGGSGGGDGSDNSHGGVWWRGGGSRFDLCYTSNRLDDRSSSGGNGYIKVKYDVPAGSNSTGIVKIINTTCTGTQTESLTSIN